MIERAARRRVLIVGAGRRVQGNFLPAFRCLDDLYEICGLHARTWARLLPVAQAWDVAAVGDLGTFDLSTVDLVAISVPTAQNAVVLQALLPAAKTLHILIDTPVAATETELAACRPLLAQFAGVTVAEDYMNFPAFTLVRDAAVRGLIGRPRSLSLFNIGYRYHGLALIRSFTGFGPVVQSWRRALGTHGTIVGYEFADGFSATVIGPYRRHEHGGGLLLEGSCGFITEAATDASFVSKKREMFVLQPDRSDGVLTGYAIVGGGAEVRLACPDLARMRGMGLADASELNLLRGCGLIEVIRSIFHDKNINRSYGYAQGLYDSFVSLHAARGDASLDPCGLLAADAPAVLPWRRQADQQTYLKASKKASAALGAAEKILVRAGDVVDATREARQGDHTALYGARVNGRELPGTVWFIYNPAWGLA